MKKKEVQRSKDSNSGSQNQKGTVQPNSISACHALSAKKDSQKSAILGFIRKNAGCTREDIYIGLQAQGERIHYGTVSGHVSGLVGKNIKEDGTKQNTSGRRAARLYEEKAGPSK
jgi:hypothetical protein